jgi:hypothetical protein
MFCGGETTLEDENGEPIIVGGGIIDEERINDLVNGCSENQMFDLADAVLSSLEREYNAVVNARPIAYDADLVSSLSSPGNSPPHVREVRAVIAPALPKAKEVEEKEREGERETTERAYSLKQLDAAEVREIKEVMRTITISTPKNLPAWVSDVPLDDPAAIAKLLNKK